MSVDRNAAMADTAREHPLRIRLRSRDDRCCPNCNEVALVFDTEADRSRCRACGSLD